jgi:cytidylate kinase
MEGTSLKLIIINGPSGVGKSTATIEIHQKFPLSLRIEIDELRRWIAAHRGDRKESLMLANEAAYSLAKTHLSFGHSVIIDKSIIEDELVDRLHLVGKELGADVYEIILTARKEIVLDRAEKRGYIPGGILTPEKLADRWDLFQEIIKSRTKALVIDTSDLSIEEVLREITEHIS